MDALICLGFVAIGGILVWEGVRWLCKDRPAKNDDDWDDNDLSSA